MLTTGQLAERWGVSVSTLRHWRVLHKGPRFVRIGKKVVRYRIEDVVGYEKDNKINTGGA